MDDNRDFEEELEEGVILPIDEEKDEFLLGLDDDDLPDDDDEKLDKFGFHRDDEGLTDF